MKRSMWLAGLMVAATLPSAATGGTKRMTVPALPTSTFVSWPAQPGLTSHACGSPVSTWAPRACSAPAISRVSLARSGCRTWAGPAASAASTSARLVIDLEPGSRTWARTGPAACGAGQTAGGVSML